MNDFELPEFPIMEYKLLKQIVKKYDNWHILEMEPEDLIQEVMIVLLQKKEGWDRLRQKSNSLYLMKSSLYIYAARVYNNKLKEKLNYPHNELAELIKEQIQRKTGMCYEYYFTLPENEKIYFDRCYVEPLTTTKTIIAQEQDITYSRSMGIELKMKQTARIEMKKSQFTTTDLGDLYHV